jgi:hypothetical protein
MTVDPPARVAAMLSLLRELADEIVVAVDSRVDPTMLGPLVAVADRVVRFRFRPPVDRPRGWLMAQCSGDWILSIDGDEVPGAALLAQLPALLRDEAVLQHHLPRRWLFPDAGSWLAELPWWPDYQVRLVRRGPTVAARTGVHGGLMAVLPNRQADAPIYHLDCVLTDEAQRTAKADRYEAERPGHRAFGGGSLNHVLYLPERSRTRAPLPVPDDDRVLIDHVLASTQVNVDPPPLPVDAVPLVDDDEIDALAGPPAAAAALPDDAYKVRLGLADHEDRRLAPGERRPLYVRVTNAGGTPWPWGLEQEPQVRVAYHWRHADGEVLHYEGLRSPFPVTVGPGDTVVVPVWVDAPAEPGRYLLDVDLVHEHVRWFDDPLTVELDVAERPPPPAPVTAPVASVPPSPTRGNPC